MLKAVGFAGVSDINPSFCFCFFAGEEEEMGGNEERWEKGREVVEMVRLRWRGRERRGFGRRGVGDYRELRRLVRV